MTEKIKNIAHDFIVNTEPLDQETKIDELATLITFLVTKAVIKFADKSGSKADIVNLENHMLEAEEACQFYNIAFDQGEDQD